MSRSVLSCLTAVLALAAVLLLNPVDAGLERTCTTEDTHRNKQGSYCGPQLSGMLHVLCRPYGYNKRSGLPDKSSAILLGGDSDFEATYRQGSSVASASVSASEGVSPSERSVFLPKIVAASYLHSKRTYGDDGDGRQGITCECCVHQCTIHELRQYCRSP